jgi:L-methionine (R)-S-oxide reductase
VGFQLAELMLHAFRIHALPRYRVLTSCQGLPKLAKGTALAPNWKFRRCRVKFCYVACCRLKLRPNPFGERGITVDIVAEIRAAKGLSEALSCVVRHFAADTGTLHLLDNDGMLHLKASSGQFPPPVLAVIQKIPVGKGMAGLAVARGEPVDACNIQTDTSGDVRPGAKATGMEGAIVVPAFDGTRIVGALGIANRGERLFSDAEKATLIEAARALAAR